MTTARSRPGAHQKNRGAHSSSTPVNGGRSEIPSSAPPSNNTDRKAGENHGSGAGGDPLDKDAVAALEALYAQLPGLECKGLCGHSCERHVDASDVERARVAAAGVDLGAPTADGECPALSRALVASGRCTVHPVRPMVCRLWGTAASMPCPHGCAPTGGPLGDGEAMGLLAASLDAGGHRGAGLRGLLAVCMTDPAASALMAARLRGNRGVEPALAQRLRTLHQQAATQTR